MRRVQLTLDEKTIAYLRRLVESGECASLSHAVRKIVGRHMREEEERIGQGSGITKLSGDLNGQKSGELCGLLED